MFELLQHTKCRRGHAEKYFFTRLYVQTNWQFVQTLLITANYNLFEQIANLFQQITILFEQINNTFEQITNLFEQIVIFLNKLTICLYI